MQIISWNIRHGGGKRIGQIIDQLQAWNADVVALSEFRGSPPSQSIAQALKKSGLVHQVSTTDPQSPTSNRLALCSRVPIRIHPVEGVLAEDGRLLHVTLGDRIPLDIIVLHVPNRDEGDKYGFHSAVVDKFQSLAAKNVIALGDTNTGVPGIDEQAPFFNSAEGNWYQQINRVEWCDVWREQNPESREYTYFHHTGTGFRIDQLFAPNRLLSNLRVKYDWGSPAVGKLRGPSDHAALIADLDFAPE